MESLLHKSIADEPDDVRAKEKRSWTVITHSFSNCNHNDNDFICEHISKTWKFIMSSKYHILIDYFQRYTEVFANFFKKRLLPLSNTCCWIHTEFSDEWTHIQYFLLLELMLAYDLSSDMFTTNNTQLAATFYGDYLDTLLLGLFGFRRMEQW